MNAAEIQALVDASVARALAAKDQEIANAIAEGLRTYADRPVGEKGAPSLQFGVVEQVLETFAYVTLDGQTDAVPINMLGGLIEGERVAVLLVPPSGNLAIGMVTPSTPSPGVPPGGTTGQVLTKIDGTDFNDDWETPSAGSGSSGFYAGGNSATSVPSSTFHTDLEWPTLALGTALLNLSTPTAPTVLTDGTYMFQAVIDPSGAPSTDLKIEFVATDTPFLAGTEMHIDDSTRETIPLAAFLHAGSVLELAATQTSGLAQNILILAVNVTRIA